jgi:aspartate-semialdehyde dehydrogenase
VGVLGASGAVGSRFLSLLQGHPWFDVVALGGGPNEVGQPYKTIADKIYNTQLNPCGIPSHLADTKIIDPNPAEWKAAKVDLVFSAVPGFVAKECEQAFADAGIPVFSNVVENRMKPLVPLLQPYINSDHIDLARQQESFKKGGGFVATNPNCSTIAMTVGLKPLLDKFGLDTVSATTLQAISGSGFPGLSMAEMYDNCVPYIGEEEEKMQTETAKILGSFDGTQIVPTSVKVSATCNRVPISNGHMICVSVKLKNKPSNIEEVRDAFRNFKGPADVQSLPTCPESPIRFFENGDRPDRPQHRLDRDYCGGMGVNVGRVRECPVNDFKYTILAHNTVIGAAGGSILNAELACKKGLIKASG